jgi:hypothetical protein
MSSLMPAKQFVTDSRRFARKGDAHDFFRAILNRYDLGQRVNDADTADLLALLKHHTEYPVKIGAGVSYLEVASNVHHTRSFWIVRVDGSRDDFSYQHCITPKKD